MNANIEGKVVVITGGSSELGEATARYLAKKGAVVVLGARRLSKLTQIADEITAEGGKVAVLKTDVSRADDVKTLVQKALDNFGKIDVMVNNAGIMSLAPLSALKVSEWDQMIDVNIKGVFTASRRHCLNSNARIAVTSLIYLLLPVIKFLRAELFTVEQSMRFGPSLKV